MENNNYDLNYTPSYDPQPQTANIGASKKKSIVAMILSCAGLFAGCIPFVSFAGIGLGIAGLIMGNKERAKNIPQARGFLIAAKACGIGSMIFSTFMSIVYIALLAAA